MKVAVVFNEAYPELTEPYQTELPKDLGFKPYFDLETSDPIAEFEAIARNLREAGFDAYILNILDNLNIFIDDYKKNKPDVVFNLVEIYNDLPELETGFAGLLELLNVPYTGAPPLALGTCQNKFLTKKILSSQGILTSSAIFVDREKNVYRHGLNYPLIVKPAFEDASVGIENDSICSDHSKLKRRIKHVLNEYKQPVVVEEFIEGRELNVSVFGDEKPKALPISEIDFSRMPKHLHNIVSYQAKWDPHHEAYHKTIPICPARLSQKTTGEIQDLAIRCFKTIGCRDYARIDMRFTKDKKIYVLEVNPNPDLTQDAGFMRSAYQAGYSYRKTLKSIVELAYKRKKSSNGL